MKIIFAGTPEFAAVALDKIYSAGHEIALVMTQPDRPAGRGMHPQASPVKRIALERQLPVFQPLSLKDLAAQEVVRAINADAMLVVAYGLILPQAVLDFPRLGCFNIHASLLPRWRGAAPIQRAILAGDTETGVCIMQMEAGLDTGPVLARVSTPVSKEDTAASLHDRLAEIGGNLAVEVLSKLPLSGEPQPDEGVTYAAKLSKAEAQIDWQQSALEVDKCIRAFNPFPGAYGTVGGVAIKVWKTTVLEGKEKNEAGRVLAVDKAGIVVACGDGAVRINELQKAGGKRLPAAQFLAGFPLLPGDAFDLKNSSADA